MSTIIDIFDILTPLKLILVILRSHLDDSVLEWRFGIKFAEWPYSISIMTQYLEIGYRTVGKETCKYWRNCKYIWDHYISLNRVCQRAEINSACRSDSYRFCVNSMSIIFFCNFVVIKCAGTSIPKSVDNCGSMSIIQWCRNSSDLSDNQTFLMNVRQKMLECRTKCPTEIIKKLSIWWMKTQKKRNISDHIGQQLDFMSSCCFCRQS